MKDFDLGQVEYKNKSGACASDTNRWKSSETCVKAFHYPFCCTGVVLADFGGSDDSYGVDCTLGEGYLTGSVKGWINYFSYGGEGYEHKKQFISVCLTEQQSIAMDVLEEMGFEKSSPIENTKYGNDLYLYTISINDDRPTCEDVEDEEED